MQPHHNRDPYFPANLDDYAPWVAVHGLVAPYGECQCGCGNKTNAAAQSDTKKGCLVGHPVRYILGHWARSRTPKSAPINPSGLCMCGCGKPAPLAKASNKRDGSIKGQPLRYIQNHRPKQSLGQAFWRHVIRGGGDTECWLWQGAIGNHGYGYFGSGGTSHLAHRVSYLIHYGELPDDLCVLHRCDVRQCVNPAHLFLGDRTENAIDKVSKGRQTRGSDFSHSKLTEPDVKAIRALHAEGQGYRRIARRFNVTRETVRDIVRRRIWKWVE